jgi:hypothetical protein
MHLCVVAARQAVAGLARGQHQRLDLILAIVQTEVVSGEPA